MPGACVIGLGRSGIAAARLLQRQGWQVTVSDSGTSEALQQMQQDLALEGIEVQLGHRFSPDADPFQQVVVSPGVRWDLPVLVQARATGIKVMGEMELAWHSLKTTPWVAITGTNGKTTTTTLIAAIFQAAGLNAPACGNIGYAACEVALSEQPVDWVIAEISSYQIESSPSIAPHIGVWTTFTPDHLARHYTLENYYSIKSHLLQQSEEQVLNGDDPYLRQAVGQWQRARWTSVTGKEKILGDPQRGAYVEDGWVIALGEPIVPVTALHMVGAHNQQNLLLAVLTARLAGIEKEAIAHAVETFPGVAHRLEYICTWQDVDYINDSKATNYDAALVGLASVNAPAILIAGGEAKEGDDSGWLAEIHQKAAAVLLIGSAAPAFAKRLGESGYSNYKIVETMEQAVSVAPDFAKQFNAKVVLLSPACASFDQFQSFEHRGDRFKELCSQIIGSQIQ
jgi:UDP-N-acetylmuramoylalanine--D-glutamate ligase